MRAYGLRPRRWCVWLVHERMNTDARMFQQGCPLCFPRQERVLMYTPRWRVIAADEPGFPCFLRVVWQRHVADMTDLDKRDQTELLAAVMRVERVLRDVVQPDKINLASLGNQTPHLHWHVIPRWRDDPAFPGSVWTPPPADHSAMNVAVHQRFSQQTAWLEQIEEKLACLSL